MSDKNALIIRNIEGFLTGSLERSLSEKKIKVKKIGPDVNEIRRYGENADAIILYVGHGIHEKTEAMVFLRDRAGNAYLPYRRG